MPSDLPFPVVGIGASAGGLEALKAFFENVPPNPDMAFVVVLHLSPDHDSVAHHILQRVTDLPVVQVTRSMPVQKNHVYVIPPAASLSMNDGYLRLTAHERPPGQPIAIDVFFRALADVHKSRSIGIVLTGGGSDGSVGLARIKEQGGITLAQQPEDAPHESMPRAAISTGMVDIVLPVAQMPGRLKDLVRNMARIHMPAPVGDPLDPDGPENASEESAADRTALRDILTVLRTRTGHDFRHYKKATVLRRIERRMQVNGVPDMQTYAAMLHQTPEETPKLLGDMLIGVTQFFRDKDAYEALERHVIAPLFNGGEGPPTVVRAWTAGCATGEEAYSMAMVLSSYADKLPSAPRVQVFATDIDEPSLSTARAGLYSAAIETDVSVAMLHGYFTRDDAGYRIKKEIRERVLFAPHNVLRDPPFSKLDLVTCRNLLIYLDRDAQMDVLRMFHFALKPGGYLFLGSSESADACGHLFTVVDKRHRLYQARGAAHAHRSMPMPAPASSDKTVRSMPPQTAAGRGKTAYAEIHQRALEQYAPPSVIVDHEANIVHMSDRAGRFLRHSGGEPSRSLPALVQRELRMELRTAMFQALHSRKSVEARRVEMNVNDRRVYVNMVVRPFRHEESGSDFMLVIFDEVEAVLNGDREIEPAKAANSVLAQLEAELQQAKDRLQLTVEQSETSTEELKASNEELQAINEELRSATEELETGKEELQSVNEELITVNSELKSKVEETAKINDDLQNLIASTDIATVFVDRGMRIKWFTPRATDIFSVIASDAGRSLLDITHRLNYADLARDAAGVFESLRTVEREVSSTDDRWYLARLLPYRSAEHRIEGAVLTFIDITDRRKAEERVRRGEAHMRLMAQSTKDFAIITIDQNGLIATWNSGAHIIFGYSEAEAVGKPLDIIFTREDVEAGEPRKEMERARAQGYSADERWLRRKDGTRIFCTGSINPMRDEVFDGYAKIARDVTEQRRKETEQESRLELTRADSHLKDEFFAIMSHELKHPLNLIQLNADLLARTPAVSGSPSTARAAETIQHSVRSQARIIEDLLDMARVQTGKLKLKLGVVSLTDTVESILSVLKHTAAAAGVDLRHDYDSADALHVDADSVRVEQIIWNLLNNGIKFTPDGGSVTVALRRDGDMARLDVIDTGEGIEPAFLAKVFEMFSQADMRHRGINRDGLGIGLAVVSQLVQAHGGRVEVDSEGKGRGARFSVWLPLARQALGASAPAAPADDGRLSGLRILVVDDSEEILDTFQALLELEGAQVTAADGGAAALQQLETSADYDLIISDIGMPNMDGYEFMRQVRTRFPDLDIPAIALTGYGTKDHVDKAAQAGFTTHLNKPISLDALIEAVSRTLGRS